MELQTKSTRMQSLLTLFNMHTTFFKKAVEGVSDEDAYNRLNTEANHMAWLAGTIVQQRYLMAQETQSQLKSTGDELFRDHQGLLENVVYPTFVEYLKDWDAITPYAQKALIDITDEKLESMIDMGGMKMTYYDLITFTIYREANCIGQLALWRRLLGYPALKYN